eukprot:CAMPEP_0181215264 /NCGR_PEP_ID=MMETSP1096-20121128/25919_1 /TAXON_ID=156174 ORGANISM="Chrysochromulina ericina, Strain CCMP281" /NCGR_SAMPLE_ID=MMETSP1096 /ASSEMBLY_ACC=CAM_ASM_000453 /LENGTH=45 /DNA_ID= /DNA_START= /DNA_END= /DNA_ORIENTATION=
MAHPAVKLWVPGDELLRVRFEFEADPVVAAVSTPLTEFAKKNALQ